jgi:hypothetical protein
MSQYKFKHSNETLSHSFEIEKHIKKVQNKLGILKDEKKLKVVDTFERYAMVYVLIKHMRYNPLPVSIHLAKRNHTMVSYIMRKANDWHDVDRDFKDLVDKIKKVLK